MTTFTTEDRELAQKEPIPFYGFYHLTEATPIDENAPPHSEFRKMKVEYRIDEGSEDLES